MRSKASYPHYGRLERWLKRIAFRLRLLIALEFVLQLASILMIILLGSLSLQRAQVFFPYLPFIYYMLALGALGFAFFLLLTTLLPNFKKRRQQYDQFKE